VSSEGHIPSHKRECMKGCSNVVGRLKFTCTVKICEMHIMQIIVSLSSRLLTCLNFSGSLDK
jgi:hypothetical protein